MDKVIWVEILSWNRDVVARHRCTGPVIHVGRGYANDVVLDDPYVAAQHLRISRGETGALVAEDLGSKSGLFADHDAHRAERVVLDGDRLLRVGRTWLRIRDENYVVAPERQAGASDRVWPIALVEAAALLAIQLVTLWLTETAEPKLSRYLEPMLGLVLLLLLWAAVWSILSRIFSGRARFERNLIVAMTGLLALEAYSMFGDYAAYSAAWQAPASYQYVAVWLLLAAICFFHLREIGRARLRLKGGVVAGLAGIGLAMQIISQTDARTQFDQQNYALHLKPPVLRLAPVQRDDRFFSDVERLKQRLDEARANGRSPG